jgi:hypothetical protein
MEDKKYEDAVKRAKALLEVAEDQNEAYNYVSTIFPELTEVYEERIIRVLINYLSSYAGLEISILQGIPVKDIIKWLEKQKNNYKHTWKPSNEQIEALENLVRSYGESGTLSPYDNHTKLLYSLLYDLKNLNN